MVPGASSIIIFLNARVNGKQLCLEEVSEPLGYLRNKATLLGL